MKNKKHNEHENYNFKLTDFKINKNHNFNHPFGQKKQKHVF